MPAGLGVLTRPLDDPGRLLDLLPDDRALCWLRGSDGLVGWGEVARFSAAGPDRFAAADAWWASFIDRMEIKDLVGVPGSGPVAFASFTFADASPGSVLVVPRVLVGRRDGQSWITEFSHGDGPSAVRAVEPVRPSSNLRYADGLLPVEGYRSAVAEAVRRMRAGRWTRPRSRTTCSPSTTRRWMPGSCSAGWPSATRPAGPTRWTGWWEPPRSC